MSIQVEKGEVFGFLGPNGAGKTTTIRHLMGFSNPEKGTARVNGLVCKSQASKILENVGYLLGEIALPEGLTGMQFIRMMQGLRNSFDEKRLKHLLDIFQLDPRGTDIGMIIKINLGLFVLNAALGGICYLASC